MATQRDIQCIFQLLHEPVNLKDRYTENIEQFSVAWLFSFYFYETGYMCFTYPKERLEALFSLCFVFYILDLLLGARCKYLFTSVVISICCIFFLNLLPYILMVPNAGI